MKGRCNREKPPCKYFHPPQHLKDQLLINGRNHLALKNALLQQMGLTPGQPMVPGQIPAVATTPYLAAGMPQVGNTFSPYFSPGPLMPAMLPGDPNNPLAIVQQNAVAQQKIARTDRIEPPPLGLGLSAPLGCLPTPPVPVCTDTSAPTTLTFLASRKRPLDPTTSVSSCTSPDDLLMVS
ncbi:hypothetical protein M8J77_008426 [Diaphorina citri]|nr:hypothetical protein M8J77_008426 [Diaphorina citri]